MENGSELYHHGILGQKHGQRNGPPYPLRDGAHSAAEKKANPSLARRAANAAANAITKIRKASQGNGHARYSRNPRKLSDEELNARIERLKREAEYEKLLGVRTREQRQSLAMKRGEQFASKFGELLGTRAGKIGERFGTYSDKVVNEVVTKGIGPAIGKIVDLPGKAIGGVKGFNKSRKDYEAKLSTAQSKKKYEDWMLANNEEYVKRLAREEKLKSNVKSFGKSMLNKIADQLNASPSSVSTSVDNGQAYAAAYMNDPAMANMYLALLNNSRGS